MQIKYIPLTQGKYAKVDAEDYDLINCFKWRVVNGYAVAAYYEGGKHLCDIPMHRLILNTPAKMDTDHKNRDKLDNRKANLRAVSRTLNNFNSPPPKDNKSGYKGVILHKQTSRWFAYINIKGKQHSLGLHKHKDGAIKARLDAERSYGVCV
jgi:hypothetical protein